MDGRLVSENLTIVQAKIEQACRKVGRHKKEVLLLPVTKKVPLEKIQWAIDSHCQHFGENYLQEALEKIKQLESQKVHWHFIGQLQRKKVKDVVKHFSYIHSVDRIELASEISKRASELGQQQKILIQVNLGGEESKGGITPSKAPELLKEASHFSNLEICGLMALPPLGNEKETRSHFQTLSVYLKDWASLLPQGERKNFKELSMGTSADYELAVEEGATIVRVGTTIFGKRE